MGKFSRRNVEKPEALPDSRPFCSGSVRKQKDFLKSVQLFYVARFWTTLVAYALGTDSVVFSVEKPGCPWRTNELESVVATRAPCARVHRCHNDFITNPGARGGGDDLLGATMATAVVAAEVLGWRTGRGAVGGRRRWCFYHYIHSHFFPSPATPGFSLTLLRALTRTHLQPRTYTCTYRFAHKRCACAYSVHTHTYAHVGNARRTAADYSKRTILGQHLFDITFNRTANTTRTYVSCIRVAVSVRESWWGGETFDSWTAASPGLLFTELSVYSRTRYGRATGSPKTTVMPEVTERTLAAGSSASSVRVQ